MRIEKIISYDLETSPEAILDGDGVSYRYAVYKGPKLICETKDPGVAATIARIFDTEPESTLTCADAIKKGMI